MKNNKSLKYAGLTAIAAFFFIKPGLTHDNHLLIFIGLWFAAMTISIVIFSVIKK